MSIFAGTAIVTVTTDAFTHLPVIRQRENRMKRIFRLRNYSADIYHQSGMLVEQIESVYGFQETERTDDAETVVDKQNSFF